MRPRERARSVIDAFCSMPDYRMIDPDALDLWMGRLIADAITAAIEEEREACASVADAWVWPEVQDKPDSNLASHVAKKIARKIRARSSLIT